MSEIALENDMLLNTFLLLEIYFTESPSEYRDIFI